MEISQESWKISRQVGQLIKNGGAGLFVDYGGPQLFGSSFRVCSGLHLYPRTLVQSVLTGFQGFRNHKIVDIFDEPGSSDLTANVDFTYLSESLSPTGSHSVGPIPQARFLLGLGLEPRMSKLLETASGERKEDIRKGATRLIDTLGMGSQYQVMGIEPGESGAGEVYPFPAKGSEGVEAALAKSASS